MWIWLGLALVSIVYEVLAGILHFLIFALGLVPIAGLLILYQFSILKMHSKVTANKIAI